MAMKNVFERLLTGFISSLMVMSFILMPIPRLSIATATENNVEEECKDYAYQKGDIYKPGCELDAALTTTSFDSSTRYSEDGDKIAAKIPGMIEQYIVALTGVILINSLNWKRLHMYNPLAYGNDCPSNLIGKMGGSMALGAASGLSNTIGDLVSNVKFQGIAKDAATHVARIKNNPIKADESTDEDQENKDAKAANNLQIESFNALIALMEGQNDAIQFKKKAAGLSALGFGLADGVEIANMIMMNGVCNIEWGKRGLDKTENASLRTAAESAKAGAIAQNLSYGNAAGASACKLASAAGSKKAIVIGSTEVLEATNSIDEARKVIKT
jgi:hypothetical protein